MGFNVVLLPAFASFKLKHDAELTKRYLYRVLRLFVLMLGPIVVMFDSSADTIVRMFYGEAFYPATYPLRILVWGMAFWATSGALGAILQGGDRQSAPTFIYLALLPLNIVMQVVFIHAFQLIGAATATSMTFLVGMVLLAVRLFSEQKAVIKKLSFVRISCSLIVSHLVCNRVIYGVRGSIVLFWVIGAISFLLTLIILREVRTDDFRSIRALFRRSSGL